MDPRIRITLKIIDELGVSAHFDLPEVSRMLGLSEPYLQRLFHRDVGKKLATQLRETRMARAAKLLIQNFRPIKTIAFECGYTDISNFYRDFKHVHGMTPMQMRLLHMTIQASAIDESLPMSA